MGKKENTTHLAINSRRYVYVVPSFAMMETCIPFQINSKGTEMCKWNPFVYKKALVHDEQSNNDDGGVSVSSSHATNEICKAGKQALTCMYVTVNC